MGLEAIIRHVKDRGGEYLVDTSSRILFYVPLVGVWEKYVADDEVLKSRAMGILINVLGIGKIHSSTRRLFAKWSHTDEHSTPRRKQVVDFSSGVVVSLTSYSAVLYIADVSLDEGLAAAPFAVSFACLSGSYYGKFNDRYR